MFNPAETCMCSSANLGSSLQLCSGAALSPCNCASDTCTVRLFHKVLLLLLLMLLGVQCQAPFVGDGTSCTLDSDSDGYPDEALDSPSCEEDPSITYCNAVSRFNANGVCCMIITMSRMCVQRSPIPSRTQLHVNLMSHLTLVDAS